MFAAVMITVQNSTTAQESYTPAVEVKVSAISCQCKNLIIWNMYTGQTTNTDNWMKF